MAFPLPSAHVLFSSQLDVNGAGAERRLTEAGRDHGEDMELRPGRVGALLVS